MDLFEEIEKHLQSHSAANIVIAGITCSGKTTLAKAVREYFSDRYPVASVSQDDYFKDLPDIPRTREGYLTDSIDAFHTAEFRDDVRRLLEDGVVIMPRYDVASNTRISRNKIVRAGKVNVFEGLHTIHLLKELADSIHVFVDTDMETCLSRRIARDTAQFGVPEARIREYWDSCIRPMCERYIYPQKADADIIISSKGGDGNGG